MARGAPGEFGFGTYRNYDWMYQRFIIEKKSYKEVADICRCTQVTLNDWVSRLGIREFMPHRKKSKILTLICKQCGVKFKVFPSFKNQKYCSQKCYGLSRRGKVKRIKLICEYCGRQFEVFPYEKNQRYCSEKCMGLARTGKKRGPFSKEVKKKMSETRKKGWQDPEVWERYSKARKKMWQDPRFRKKVCGTHLKNWQNPEFQEMMAIARNMKPNNLEQFFDEITPDSIRYTGGGGFFIRCKNRVYLPDFKIKGQRKIIELFGDYWHKGEDPNNMIKEYAEAGWKCKVFWEHEVYNKTERVLDETMGFIKKEKSVV